MVNVNGQKMSKSLKNFKTIRELIKSGPMTLRYFVMTVNYRKPLDFTEEALRSASEAWKNINVALSFLDLTKDAFKSIDKNESIEDEYKEKISFELSQKKLKFSEALGNDLNTAGAIAIIYDLAKPLKNFLNQFQRVEGFKIDLNEKFFLLENFKTLEKLTEVLGLKKEVLVKERKITEEEISTLINERLKAKKEKDYTKADEIRNLLKEKGIELIDQSKEITTWIRI